MTGNRRVPRRRDRSPYRRQDTGRARAGRPAAPDRPPDVGPRAVLRRNRNGVRMPLRDRGRLRTADCVRKGRRCPAVAVRRALGNGDHPDAGPRRRQGARRGPIRIARSATPSPPPGPPKGDPASGLSRSGRDFRPALGASPASGSAPGSSCYGIAAGRRPKLKLESTSRSFGCAPAGMRQLHCRPRCDGSSGQCRSDLDASCDTSVGAKGNPPLRRGLRSRWFRVASRHRAGTACR